MSAASPDPYAARNRLSTYQVTIGELETQVVGALVYGAVLPPARPSEPVPYPSANRLSTAGILAQYRSTPNPSHAFTLSSAPSEPGLVRTISVRAAS